jgi:exopolyphosphatase/guanosine-5'-triphosphate,3'-diphosphate pyrophosphatase
VAAIDIGTNTTNLLISSSTGDDVLRLVTTTRLGAGVDRTRHLSESAIEKTLECLRLYRSHLDDHGVTRLRVVASSACRDADNRDEFFDRASDVLGVRPDILSGDDEGRLTYMGAVTGLPLSTTGHMVIDIGGGSTEVMIGRDALVDVRSLNVGAVRITERYLQHDPPQPEELTNAIGEVQDLFADECRDMEGFAFVSQLIGCSGTILTAAAIELGLATDDRAALQGFTLTRAAAEDVFRTVATEALADRVHNPGLPRDRADIIVGGCCVLVALMRSLDAPEITVSTRNILDGLCHELRVGS